MTTIASQRATSSLFGRSIGMIAVVSGTTIGAGMLAMPLTSAGIGFIPSVLLLIFLWFVLTISALYFVELYQFTSSDKGLADLSQEYYGPLAKIFIVIVLFLFLYAISTAYILGGSEIISKSLEWSNLSSTLVFILLFGIPVILGNKIIDIFNRILFFAMLISFLALLVLILPYVSNINLLEIPIDNLLIISAAPVFFTSFGFHVVIPNVVSYLHNNISIIRRVMWIGTLIPLIIYILWQLSIHGIIGQEEFVQAVQQNTSVAGLAAAVAAEYGELFGYIISIFSSLALVTSFIGVSLGSLSLFNDTLGKIDSKLINNQLFKFLFIYLIPFLVALFYIDAFIFVIGYAGLLFAIYVILLPVSCIYRARTKFSYRYTSTTYKVPGGALLLIFILLVGIATIVVPPLITAGYLPSVKS